MGKYVSGVCASRGVGAVIINANSLHIPLRDKSVHCCVTSPPYWGLRDYGTDGQLGLEQTPEQYVENMCYVFGEVWRVLRDDGTLWLNLGDTYSAHKDCKSVQQTIAKHEAHVIEKGKSVSRNSKILKAVGLKNKDLVGIPWMVAFALRKQGWYLRSDIIWSKPNPMPESVTDRPTKAHEYLFLLSKSQKYYYDADAIKDISLTYENRLHGVVRNREYGYNSKENNNPQAYLKNIKGNISECGVTRTTEGLNRKTQAEKTSETRNKRTVWEIATQPYSEAHFATFPEKLVVDPIKAGCPEGGIVLDPFGGSGTTKNVAERLGRKAIILELSSEYIEIAKKRCYSNQCELEL